MPEVVQGCSRKGNYHLEPCYRVVLGLVIGLSWICSAVLLILSCQKSEKRSAHNSILVCVAGRCLGSGCSDGYVDHTHFGLYPYYIHVSAAAPVLHFSLLSCCWWPVVAGSCQHAAAAAAGPVVRAFTIHRFKLHAYGVVLLTAGAAQHAAYA